MSQISLPPVAKSFYMFCKKCDVDRYHIVLAHTSSTTAKVECEVCHSKKSFSIPKEGSTRKTTASRANSPGSASSRQRSHTGQYENRVQNFADVASKPYSIKGKYVENEKIQHPKFGLGFIQKVYSDKVDVIFNDEVRTLMHNRT